MPSVEGGPAPTLDITKIRFHSSSDRFGISPTNQDFVPVSEINRNLITEALVSLYETSVTARTLINSVISQEQTINVTQSVNVLGIAIEIPSTGMNVIGINPALTSSTVYMTKAGTLTDFRLELVLAHEMSHVLSGQDWDPNPFSNEAAANSQNYDFVGPNVRVENEVAIELGLVDKVRVSYATAFSLSSPVRPALVSGLDYAPDFDVEIVRYGN